MKAIATLVWNGSDYYPPEHADLLFAVRLGRPGKIRPRCRSKELEEAHVIRREERSGTITHELTHDRFIEPIQKSNKVWLGRYQEAEAESREVRGQRPQSPRDPGRISAA